MKDDNFGEYVSGLIRELDPPPPAPRDAMWANIEAARRGRRPDASSPHAAEVGNADAPPHRYLRSDASSPGLEEAGRRPATTRPRLRPSRSRWMRGARWAAPLAAALLVGIGIGRVYGPAEPGPAREPALAGEASGAAAADLPYRMIAAEHLNAAEALLAALPHDARRGDVAAVSSWAEDLLMTTRLLLDSPAGDDPHMAILFQDLELVLAQIASISAARAEDEVELIEEGMRQNDVLLRVRAATMQRERAGI